MSIRSRWVLLSAAAVVAVVLAVGIPWTVSGMHSEPSRRPEPPAQPGAKVAQRVGAAEQLVATDHGSVSSGDAVSVGPASTAPLARGEQQLSLDLLAQLDSTPNATVSPASLALALAMIEHGARGATLREIQATLHTTALSPDEQGYAWQGLTDEWTKAARHSGVELASANSVWQDRALQVQPAFLTDLARYYHAGVWQADFAHDRQAAVDAINRWTSQHTHGRIAKLFDRLPADTKAVLANAIYFNAKWQQPFDAHETADGRFMAQGGAVTTPFMSATGAFASTVAPTYSAVQLPYRGGRFAALAIMPTSGTLSTFVRGLSVERLTSIVDGLHSGSVALRIPKFHVSSTMQLGPALMKLGLHTALTDGADFSGIAKRPLKISQVVQRVYLSVAEKGTEAAAATGIAVQPGMAVARQLQITLDHPFLFLVRDTSSGAILFASAVQKPTS